MSWFRRIGVFIALNIVVVLTIGVITSVLGLNRYVTAYGLDYGSLMGFCLVWGMGGAFISLLLSKVMVKWTMGVQVIDPNTNDPTERNLVEIVHRLARAGGIDTMPEVGIYPSQEVNAFATGPTKNRALVAVSAGLLRSMDNRSLEGVLGHEITHITNGDMVTMTLIQGVVNAFVMALARIIAFAIDSAMRGDRDDRRGGGLGGFTYMLTVMGLEMVLFIPGSMIVAWFSRQREFRADAGGAKLAGRDKMISALRTLKSISESPRFAQVAPDNSQPAVAALKISSGPQRSSFSLLRASHPPLEERIARLESLTV